MRFVLDTNNPEVIFVFY